MFFSKRLCAKAERMFWNCDSSVWLFYSDTDGVLFFRFFFFLSKIFPFLRSPSLSLSENIGVSLCFRGNTLMSQRIWSCNEIWRLFLCCSPLHLYHTYLYALFFFHLTSPCLFLSPILHICRGRGWRRVPGCGHVGWEASAPTAESHARGAVQPPGASDTFFSFFPI